jgi:putative two-component system protein, hydrogenase maturation factor HypX/HoxX
MTDFDGFDHSDHVARHYVHKVPHARTPRHLAIHRELGWVVPAD